MLQFLAPIWLSVPAAAGLLGVWALWRGQRKRRPVSSLRLWRGLQAPTRGARRRVIDPLWLLVLLAGLLAGLALAGPRWVSSAPVPLAVEWSVRTPPSTGPGPTSPEAWVRCPQAPDDTALRVNGTLIPLSAGALRQGLALPVAPDTSGRVRLELHSDGKFAATTFKDVAGLQTFGLLQAAPPSDPVDPELRKVFAMQRGARPNDPSVRPRVLLVTDPHVPAEELAQADLVLALPPAALPGVTLNGEVSAAATASAPTRAISGTAGWTPTPSDNGAIAWPGFVKLQDVHVIALRQITATSPWQTLATVTASGQTYPWILARPAQTADGRSALWLYLASAPTTQTTWPNSPGFVLFCAEMQHRALGATAQPAAWPSTPDPSIAASPLPLDRFLGILAFTLLLAAIAWYLARAA